MTLKERFLDAVSNGYLGEADDFGVVVSLKQFKKYFKDVKSDYINSFLPAAVIEIGQQSTTHTKYVFRVRKGLYRVHPDALQGYMKGGSDTDTDDLPHLGKKVEEPFFSYGVQHYN